MKLRVKHVKWLLIASTLFIFSSIVTFYLWIGCGRDWVVIGGLCLDVMGALLLASPDLEKYRQYSRLGQLYRLHPIIVDNPRERYISRHTTENEIFLEEMREIFNGKRVGEESIFRIKKLGGNQNPVNYVLSHKMNPSRDDKKISISNVDRHFQESIRKEKSAVRRLGAITLLSGFSLQIVGLVVDSTPFVYGLC